MKKSILSIMLIFSILSSLITTFPVAVSAATNGTCGDNLTWSFDDDGTLTISGTGKIAWGLDEYPWYSFRSYINTVIIQNGVISIDYAAFRWCDNLTSITIPNSVTHIGDFAFSDCDSLTSISIPNSVTDISYAAFWNCDRLTSITIPNSVTDISYAAFWNCDRLTSITIPNSVTHIGSRAFEYCYNLTDVYYNGTESEWRNTRISFDNQCLEDATIHYKTENSEKEEISSVSNCVISNESLYLRKINEKGTFNCNFKFDCEGTAKNLRIHFETDDCIDWDMSQHPFDFSVLATNTGDIVKSELSSGRYDSNMEMYCDNLERGIKCNNQHKIKMIISGDNFETVETEASVNLIYIKKVTYEDVMQAKLKLASLSRRITNEVFTKQTMLDSKLDDVKEFIKPQNFNKDINAPNEVYEAFAKAILNKVVNIEELDTDMEEMTKQIYAQLKAGISNINEQIEINGQYYKVTGFIWAMSWNGELQGVSSAKVYYNGKTIELIWNSSGWTPKEFAKNSNNAIAAFGGVLAQLNSELWKDFMAYYVVDGAQLAGVRISKDNVDEVLDITEKVIRAVCGKKEDAENLVNALGDTAKDALKNGLIKGNGVKAFIKSEFDNGDTIIKYSEEYLKVKEKFVELEERFRSSNSPDELLRDYENIKKLLSELERGINQDFTLGSNGRIYFSSSNIKISNSLGSTLFEMKDGNVLNSSYGYEPCYESALGDEMSFYGSVDIDTPQFTIEANNNSVAITGNGTINAITTNGNIILSANQDEKKYEIEAIGNNSSTEILTQNINGNKYSKLVTGSLNSNDMVYISYVDNKPIIDADTENLFDVITKTDEGDVQEVNVSLNESDTHNDKNQINQSSTLKCSDWAKDEIQEANNNGLIPSLLINDDLTQTINRQEFAAIAVKLFEKLGGNVPNVSLSSTPFTDCDASGDYSKYIAAAYTLGITTGTSETTFSPYDTISREELATMMYRVLKHENANGWHWWSIYNKINLRDIWKYDDDYAIDKYAIDAIYYLSKIQVIKGISDSLVAPNDTATRQEALLISLRSYKYVINPQESRIKIHDNIYYDDTYAVTDFGNYCGRPPYKRSKETYDGMECTTVSYNVSNIPITIIDQYLLALAHTGYQLKSHIIGNGVASYKGYYADDGINFIMIKYIFNSNLEISFTESQHEETYETEGFYG